MTPEGPSDSANPVPTLEEKVDALAIQLSQLVNLYTLQNQTQSHHSYIPEAQTEEEIGEFLSHHKEETEKSAYLNSHRHRPLMER